MSSTSNRALGLLTAVPPLASACGQSPKTRKANPTFTTLEFTGQEIRFDVDPSTGGNVGAIEVRVFAPAR